MNLSQDFLLSIVKESPSLFAAIVIAWVLLRSTLPLTRKIGQMAETLQTIKTLVLLLYLQQTEEKGERAAILEMLEKEGG